VYLREGYTASIPFSSFHHSSCPFELDISFGGRTAPRTLNICTTRRWRSASPFDPATPVQQTQKLW